MKTSIVLTIMAFVASSPAEAGFALMDEFGARTVIYRSGPWLLQGYCPDGTMTPTESLCSELVTRIEASDAYSYFHNHLNEGQVALDAQLAEAQAQVLAVDRRLEEYLQADPTQPNTATLESQIARLQGQLTDCEVRIRSTRDEIAEVERRIRDGGPGVDLSQRVNELWRTLAGAESEKSSLAEELAQARQSLINASVVTHSRDVFELLQQQRARHVARVADFRARSRLALEGRARFAQFVSEIVDAPGFVFEIDRASRFFEEAAMVFSSWGESQKASGIVNSRMTSEGMKIVIPGYTRVNPMPPRIIEHRAQLAWMYCTFEPHHGTCPGMKVYPPRRDFDSTFIEVLHLFGTSFVASAAEAPEPLRPWFQSGREADGEWTVYPVCGAGTITPDRLGEGRCEARVKQIPVP